MSWAKDVLDDVAARKVVVDVKSEGPPGLQLVRNALRQFLPPTGEMASGLVAASDGKKEVRTRSPGTVVVLIAVETYDESDSMQF